MSNSSTRKKKRINVHERVKTKKTLGIAEQWPISYVLWGSALPFKPVIVDWENNQSAGVLWKLTFGGKRDFNVGNTQFSCADYVWKPISVSYHPSDTIGVSYDTIIECTRIDQLQP